MTRISKIRYLSSENLPNGSENPCLDILTGATCYVATETPGQIVKRLRKKLDLTQAYLAQKSGLQQSKISRIENDQNDVKLNDIEKIAHALGVSLAELLGRPELPSDDQVQQHELTEEEAEIAKLYEQFTEVRDKIDSVIMRKMGKKKPPVQKENPSSDDK